MTQSDSSPKGIIAQLPRVIAHRGASWARPENTQCAFDLALDEGCDGMELDLQLTRDDRAVLFHDDTLEKLGLAERRIGDYSRDELMQLDVGRWFDPAFAGQPILDLSELLRLYASQTDLYLELKPVDEARSPQRAKRLAEVVATALGELERADRHFVLSFSEPILEAVKEAQPQLRLVRNIHERATLTALDDPRIQRMHAICVNIDAFTVADVEPVHAAGRPLYAYTCDTPEQLRHARDLGVSAVITNRPAATRELITKLWREART